MTPQERRTLIETPITFFVGPKRGWGGYAIHSTVPVEGQRIRPAVAREDGFVDRVSYQPYDPEAL